MIKQVERIYLSAEYRIEENAYEAENTDVIVQLTNGNKYTASFFTYENILKQKLLNQQRGEYLNGKYFWVRGMVLIEKCSSENIMEVVKDLIQEGDFEAAFQSMQ